MTTNKPYLTTAPDTNDYRDLVVGLFHEAKSANEERRRELALLLGPLINKADVYNFEKLLRTIDLTGNRDVTGWPRHSVRSLLRVCAENKTWITVKNGERFLSPVSYPSEGQLLENLVDAVMTGEWF